MISSSEASDGHRGRGRHRSDRQVLGQDDAAGRHHHRALHDVLQLAHVPRPVVTDQAIERVGRDAALAELAGVLGQEVLDQQRNVAPPLAQRRQVQGDDVEPIVEVLAELPLAHQGLEVAVGGGQHADVDANRLVAAEPLDRPLLQRAQQLGLQLQRHVADLVEVERAAVGQLELAEASLLGVGEGATLVAEHLGFQERAGNGRAGDGDERPARPPAVVMDGAGHQLLAGARLAAQQHGHVAAGDAADRLVDVLHARMAADQGAELADFLQPGLESRHLLRQPAAPAAPARPAGAPRRGRTAW